MEVLPNSVSELIDMLNRIYPERCPHLKESDREIWSYHGSRQVVNFLNRLKHESEENILEN